LRLRANNPSHEETFDLTAMIDVMLFVFLFFLVATQFSQATRKPIDLPRQPGEQKTPDMANSVLVAMERDGTIFLDDKRVDAEALLAFIKARSGASGTGLDVIDVIIRADRQCPAGHLNRLAARLSSAGVKQWKLATSGDE
jgi:biopolymer transport protein ExbD